MSTRTIEAGAITRLIIELGGGDIRLRPHDAAGVLGTIDGKRADDAEVIATGDQLRIRSPRGWSGPLTIDLGIPDGIDVDVRTGSADLACESPLGRARIRTGSGEVELARVDSLDCTTGSGGITVDSIGNSSSTLYTGSGDITVGDSDAALRVRTASGDISIGRLRASLQGNSASGDVNIDATSDDVQVRTASGDVNVGIAHGLPAWLDLSTVSGDVEVDLDQTAQPGKDEAYVSLHVRTASGDITVGRG